MDHGSNTFNSDAHRNSEPAQEAGNLRKLHSKLRGAADHGSPRNRLREQILLQVASEANEGSDHHQIPRHRSSVRDEESSVAVENAETPSRQGKKSGPREEDSNEGNGQLPFGALESRRDCVNQERRRQDSDQNQKRNHERQQTEHG